MLTITRRASRFAPLAACVTTSWLLLPPPHSANDRRVRRHRNVVSRHSLVQKSVCVTTPCRWHTSPLRLKPSAGARPTFTRFKSFRFVVLLSFTLLSIHRTPRKALLGHWSRASPAAHNASTRLAEQVATDRLAHSFNTFHTPYNEIGLFGVHVVAENESMFVVVNLRQLCSCGSIGTT